jgi:hypothetical protein
VIFQEATGVSHLAQNPFLIDVTPDITMDGIKDFVLGHSPVNDPGLPVRKYFNKRLFFAETKATGLADVDPTPLREFLNRFF